MEITELKRPDNLDVIAVLEDALELAKGGRLSAIAVSWVTVDGGMSGQCSEGHNNIMMWAALEHHSRSFYENVICGEE